jgi:hypothetical protein
MSLPRQSWLFTSRKWRTLVDGLKKLLKEGPLVYLRNTGCVFLHPMMLTLKTKLKRILLLTGRAGTGKTSTIRVLAREMGFDILEWKSSAGGTVNTPSNRRNAYYHFLSHKITFSCVCIIKETNQGISTAKTPR